MSTLDAAALAEVRAALAAGASPAAALLAVGDRRAAHPGALDAVVATVRAGEPLADAAERVDTGDPAADLLVRALGVAERTGAGSAAAVEQAIAAARDEATLASLLRSRTVQARGTAVVLTAVPVLAWALLVATDVGTLRFYATGLGAATGGLAVTLAAAGQWWSRRLVAAAGRAGAEADPLAPRRSPRDHKRMAALGVPGLVVGLLAGGPATGLVAGGAALAVGARRRPGDAPAGAGGDDASSGGAAEAVELVTVALTAGLSASAALAAVAPLAPPAARPALRDAGRRLRAGWSADTALADTGLAALGDTLAVTERWGAPAAPALRRLAEDLRAARRAAVEEAAERTQLTLIFPTTLLTLPAFVLGVVPPLLWTAFAA